MHARAQTHTHTHTHQHHKGKLRQLLGTQHKQPHQTCRQTDDYLHDKDLKYSPQNVFPWSSSTTFFPCAPSVQESWFWHKKTPALTAHLPGLRTVFFFFQFWREEGAEEPYSCLLLSRKPPSDPRETHAPSLHQVGQKYQFINTFNTTCLKRQCSSWYWKYQTMAQMETATY